MDQKNKEFLKLTPKESLLPKEEMLETTFRKNKLIIGIPKEISHNENRIALVPEAIHLLIENGHRVLLEEYAGASAHFTNEQYAAAGAEIVSTSNEVYKADLIIKIAKDDPAFCFVWVDFLAHSSVNDRIKYIN